MKILVIGDIHGRKFWREPVKEYLDKVDKIVFLGDELDPYQDEEEERPTFEEALGMLEEIIALKEKYPDKIVLLLGNHSMHYRNKQFAEIAKSTRFNGFYAIDARELYNKHKDFFKLCYIVEMGGKKVIFSHAGISHFWLKYICGFEVDDNLEENINNLEESREGIEKLGVIGRYRTWAGEKTGSILWCDLREIVADKKLGKDVMQIFGHTRINKKGTVFTDYNLNCVDSRAAFLLDEDLKLTPVGLDEEKGQTEV